MYTNIRGVRGKRAGLIEVLESEKPDFFLVTTTRNEFTDRKLYILW